MEALLFLTIGFLAHKLCFPIGERYAVSYCVTCFALVTLIGCAFNLPALNAATADWSGERLAAALDSRQLQPLGDFTRIVYRGFCPLTQLHANIAIAVGKVFTFGKAPLHFVDFCPSHTSK